VPLGQLPCCGASGCCPFVTRPVIDAPLAARPGGGAASKHALTKKKEGNSTLVGLMVQDTFLATDSGLAQRPGPRATTGPCPRAVNCCWVTCAAAVLPVSSRSPAIDHP